MGTSGIGTISALHAFWQWRDGLRAVRNLLGHVSVALYDRCMPTARRQEVGFAKVAAVWLIDGHALTREEVR